MGTFLYLIPELILVTTALVVILEMVHLRRVSEPTRVPIYTAIVGLLATVVAGVVTLSFVPGSEVVADHLALFGRFFVPLIGLGLIGSARGQRTTHAAEYIGVMLLALVGLMIVFQASDLVLLLVALELISIPTYVLLFLARTDTAAMEATAKYFFLGIVASAVTVYGIGFVYGATGATRLAEIGRLLSGTLGTTPDGFHGYAALTGAVLLLAGLGFKMAAVPFHFYAPDVYDGTTSLVTAFLSIVPKMAALVALVRLYDVLPGLEPSLGRMLLVVGMVSIVWGNAMAIRQDRIRRMMAYSSISHIGYMLLGLAAADGASFYDPPAIGGIASTFFYLLSYTLATLGLFAAIVYWERPGRPIDRVDQLAGLGKTSRWTAGALSFCLLSLTGIPPLIGFWGKLFVIAAGLGCDPEGPISPVWFVVAGVVMVVNAAVAAGYYFRLIGVMYFRESSDSIPGCGAVGAAVTAWVCVFFLVLLGLAAGPCFQFFRMFMTP